jgi:hypothetical protein
MTNIKIVLVLFFIIISILTFQGVAYSEPTKWEDAETSLSQLLNSGWKVSAHSSSHAVTASAPGVTSFDAITFTYLLVKNDKYITCLIVNPRPPVARSASCRRLN